MRWLEKGTKIFQGVFIMVYKGSERSGEKTSSHLFRPIDWVHVLVNFIRPMACCRKNKLTVITRTINKNIYFSRIEFIQSYILITKINVSCCKRKSSYQTNFHLKSSSRLQIFQFLACCGLWVNWSSS